MKNLVTTILLAGVFLCSCSDSTCISHTGRSCDEGVVYWIDSCGNYQELIEECRCGCRADRSGCKRCNDCTCTQAGTCCDGCLPINEDELCDDGNPGTRLDLCREGTCAGWVFSVEEPALPAEPAAAEPVRLQSWTCPVGWSPVEHWSLAFSWCRPPPLPRLRSGVYITPHSEGEQDGDRPVCEPEVDGTFPVLGHALCQPLGDPCPAGEWPEIPPEVTGTRIWVKAGAVNGDGTPGLPFGSVQAAVDAAAPGDVVAIASGTYTEAVSVDRDLTLWGKCVQETVIQAPNPPGEIYGAAVLIPLPAQVSLRNLRLSGGQYGVRLNWDRARVSLEGVWIQQATEAGINAQLGTMTLRNVLVDSTRSNASNQEGMGIVASDGVSLTAQSTTIENNRRNGLLAYSPATSLDLQDVAIRNTQSEEASGSFGRGLEIGFGVQAVVARGLFDRNREQGILVSSANARLQLEDAVVRDTRYSNADGSGGSGVWVQHGAIATLTRVLLERNRDNAIGVDGEGTDLQLEDVAVLDTRTDASGGVLGRSALVECGASLTARRCLFEESRAVAILALEAGTQVTLEDVAVLLTYSSGPDNLAGLGLLALAGASVALTRGLFEQNRQMGIAVGDLGTFAEFEDLTVRNTRGEYGTGLDGTGLLVFSGGRATITRGLLEGNRSTGIEVTDPDTFLQMSDVTIRMTHGQQLDRMFGWGLQVTAGARLEWIRGFLERNSDAAMVIDQPGTVAVLEDLTVHDTLSSERIRTGGEGLYVATGASATCSRCLFERNRNAGLYCRDAGTTLTLEDLTVLDTHCQYSDLLAGYGLAAAGGATVTLQRGRLEGNHSIGVGASGPGTRLFLKDVTVLQTRSRESDLFMGRGLEANLGAEVEVIDGRFEQNRDVGIAAFSPGTRLSLSRVVVNDTQQRECVTLPEPDSCEGLGHGSGVGAFQNARVTLEGVEIEAAQLAGLQLAEQGAVFGKGVALRTHPIGVNIQGTSAGYDFFDEVRALIMEDNWINFDTTQLPIPDPLQMGQ